MDTPFNLTPFLRLDCRCSNCLPIAVILLLFFTLVSGFNSSPLKLQAKGFVQEIAMADYVDFITITNNRSVFVGYVEDEQ